MASSWKMGMRKMRLSILVLSVASMLPCVTEAQTSFVGTWDFYTVATGDPRRPDRMVEQRLEVKEEGGVLKCRLNYEWNRKAYFSNCTVEGGALAFTATTSNDKHLKGRMTMTDGTLTYPDGDFKMNKLTRK